MVGSLQFKAQGRMGGAASKATRKYPSPSRLSNHPTSPIAHPPSPSSAPFPLPAQTKEHPLDVRAKLEGNYHRV